jgi:hypothetical protein
MGAESTTHVRPSSQLTCRLLPTLVRLFDIWRDSSEAAALVTMLRRAFLACMVRKKR